MNMTQRTRRSAGLAAASALGFTLIETLIAIGALLLIALGLAQIFDSTTKTVTVGRRVSAMTEYAATLESRFRADFQRMTRDGFLIIRNEYANNGSAVPLHADQRASDARRRRIDELMFFVKGPVSSAREAMVAGFPATSNEASIYYGHGQRHREELTPTQNAYRRPRVYTGDLDPRDQLGFDVRPGNPNRFASSWNLSRHVTVLAQPTTSVTRTFGNGNGETPWPFGLSNLRLVEDAEYQIGLRPAASSIFRAISRFLPLSADPLGLYAIPRASPQLSSGVVDIATTDLTEIRQIVTTVMADPIDVNNLADLRNRLRLPTVSSTLNVLGFMQQWMDDALPAFSMGSVGNRSRMRSEPTAPDFMGVLGEMQTNPSNLVSLQNAIERANQMAVASSVFIPSCTEFIVEWSFGKVDTATGQVIWHGKERRVDFDGDGSVNDEIPVALPYRGTLPGDLMSIPLQIRTDTGIIVETPRSPSSLANPAGIDEWLVNPVVIHRTPNIGWSYTDPLPFTSYFGYYDPTFNPDRRNDSGDTIPDGDYDDPGDALSPTVPWAWPELIRITLTLTDPIDPTFEQSFQFVLDAPGNPVY